VNSAYKPVNFVLITLLRRTAHILVLLLIQAAFLGAQPAERKNSPEDYIAKYREEAISQMQIYGIPASITLAQGMLESGNGNSALSVYANNHFGIKCHKEWSGQTYIMDDDAKNECFRKYEHVLDSYNDHSLFLKTRDRYAFLFNLTRSDYKGWARGLKEAGYATHPLYAEMLIDLIEKYKLSELDKLVDMPVVSESKNTKTIPKLSLRPVVRFNGSKFVIAQKGDSYFKIASAYGLEVEQLLKFNDLDSKAQIQRGQKIYIVRKRRKAAESTHVVQRGESMHSIAQLHGVRIYWLYKRNQMKQGEEPKVGDILILRKKGRRHIVAAGN
jgi:LysM repeat protein